MSEDRLAEIEAFINSDQCDPYGGDLIYPVDDLRWLIEEVKRLRKEVTRYHEIYRLVEPVLKQELYSDEWERIQALRNGDQRTSESAQQLR